VLEAIAAAELIVFCPSNPIVSIGPILAVPGLRAALADARAPKVAVSPIVAGRALRGPADQMLGSLGHDVSALGVARLYGDLVQGFVMDSEDEALRADIEALGVRVVCTETVMSSDGDRRRLALSTVDFGLSLSGVATGAA
ncbi:MAG: 2-phospho-L-lactate transferase CofD family protein, partial [Chloroflexota bacterium]|nr:2-phospho-L-lactate transferase CofD family protein [Chloroflexota bacterium]